MIADPILLSSNISAFNIRGFVVVESVAFWWLILPSTLTVVVCCISLFFIIKLTVRECFLEALSTTIVILVWFYTFGEPDCFVNLYNNVSSDSGGLAHKMDEILVIQSLGWPMCVLLWFAFVLVFVLIFVYRIVRFTGSSHLCSSFLYGKLILNK